MTNRIGLKYVPGLLLGASVVAVALASGGCSAVTAIEQAAQGCNEFPGSVGTLMLGGDAQAFVQAGADVVTTANNMETAVLASCEGIDGDLQVTDTWTAMGPTMGGTTNAELTEACNQASLAITAILQGDAGAQAECSLSVTSGQCQVSATAEASCEGQCSASGSCTPPDITAACQPGDISGQCSGMCEANATCEGSATVSAQCQGSCEADCAGSCTPGTLPTVHCEGTCMGMCTGTCTAMGGPGMMVDSAACAGTCSGQCNAECDYTPGTPAHCDGTCNGSCDGNCKITATGGVSCGAMATCRGACSVMVTAPTCEGQITPPACNASANCQASCESHASLTAACTPPTVQLECGASASGSLQTLVTTLSKNLPAIISAVQTQGPLALQATANLATTGSSVVQDLGSASGKALACAEAAATAGVSATASITVTVQASASVSTSAGGPAPPAM
jgi:hypothetical protein